MNLSNIFIYFDDECEISIGQNPSLMIPWILSAAYAYYEMSDPILSDSYYDQLCKRAAKVWDTLEHWHKDLIDVETLGGSGSITLGGKFPGRAIGGYMHWARFRKILSMSDEELEKWEASKNKRLTSKK